MTATATPAGEYLAASGSVVSAANGIDYTYRQVGEGTPALVLLQHFRGNLDNWDPALVDALARWASDAIGAVGEPERNPEGYLGVSDPMILPHFSYLLAGLIPQARLKIYPDAAHGFLFQHHADFARDVDAFLTERRPS
jgi:pimeloyl-ACP methyl ester carboxylesterase